MPVSNGSSSTTQTLVWASVAAALLQVGFSSQVSLFGGTFNFPLALAAAFSLSGDPALAVWVGFFSGLFYDLTSSAPVGLMALLLTLASFAAAQVARGITPGANMESIRIVVVYSLAVNLANGLALFALGTETSLFYALCVHGLACAALDCVAALPFLVLVGPRLVSGTFTGRAAGRGAGRPAATFATPRHRSPSSRGVGALGSGGKHGKRSSGGLSFSGKGSSKRGGKRYKGIR